MGDSDPIHALNDEAKLRLEADQVHNYLRFFCSCIEGEDGRFLIVEKASDLRFAKPVSEEYEQTLAEVISPLSLVFSLVDGGSEPLGFRTTATVLYGNSLFSSDFELRPNGRVKMADDEELLSDVPVVTDEQAYGHRLKVKAWLHCGGELRPLATVPATRCSRVVSDRSRGRSPRGSRGSRKARDSNPSWR